MDFSLTRFLDRFAFKNPKKAAEEPKEVKSVVQAKHAKVKEYKQQGSRGIPVTALTDRNCTEDERFIFNYLERRRQIMGKKEEADSDSEADGDLDDDEFDSYLDGLSAKGSSKSGEQVDYMKEMNGLPDSVDGAEEKGKKRKKSKEEDGDSEAEDDWNESGDVSDVSMSGEEMSDVSDLDDDDDSDDDEDGNAFSDSDDEGGRANKGAMVSEKEFNRKLKNSADMSSLFAAADDFGELLEATGKIKKHGTTEEVSTKDKASEKQLAWEQNRFKSGGKGRTMGKATLSAKSHKRFKK